MGAGAVVWCAGLAPDCLRGSLNRTLSGDRHPSSAPWSHISAYVLEMSGDYGSVHPLAFQELGSSHVLCFASNTWCWVNTFWYLKLHPGNTLPGKPSLEDILPWVWAPAGPLLCWALAEGVSMIPNPYPVLQDSAPTGLWDHTLSWTSSHYTAPGLHPLCLFPSSCTPLGRSYRFIISCTT